LVQWQRVSAGMLSSADENALSAPGKSPVT
jgi:hypothetical protein